MPGVIETEEDLMHRVGYRAYGLLLRLRRRDPTEPARADDFVTGHDGRTSVINNLQALERAGLLTRRSSMTPSTGKVVYYETHIADDPMRPDA